MLKNCIRRAVEKDKTISIATVYRTIKLFEEAGIIEKLDIGDGRARYEEAGEHHEHLIDVETGEIIEFQNEELEEMKRQVALNMGYELVDHRLELFGKKKKKNKNSFYQFKKIWMKIEILTIISQIIPLIKKNKNAPIPMYLRKGSYLILNSLVHHLFEIISSS